MAVEDTVAVVERVIYVLSAGRTEVPRDYLHSNVCVRRGSTTMRICIVSDPYCDTEELERRRVMEGLFADALTSIDASVEVSRVWMSDISLHCNDKGIRIELAKGGRYAIVSRTMD